MTDPSEQVARRNTALLAIDYVGFGVAVAILAPATVLPNLVRLLGGSRVAVGLLGAVMMGGWMLPQLLSGRLVAGRPLVKWYSVAPLLISRTLLALSVPAVLWLAPRSPGLALVAVLGGYTAFTLIDALSGVPWLEMLSKAVPQDRRGRVMGAAQAVSSLLAFGAGLWVKEVLGGSGSALGNHLLLVGVAAGLFYVNPIAQALIREPRGVDAAADRQPTWREYLPRLAAILRTDARFAWSTVMRCLSGLADMGAAFYVLYATERLGLPLETIGLFISAGVLGSLLAGVLLGPLADRRGCAEVIKVVMLLRLLCPALALAAPSLASLHPSLAIVSFLAIYAAMGMANGAWFVGFVNYVLEIAPPAERTTYAGLANTLTGLLLVAPPIAGWLAEAYSYEVLFAVVLGMAILGVLATVWGMQAVQAVYGKHCSSPARAPAGPQGGAGD